MYEYCEQRGIRYERCGKLIVATNELERSRLADLERRARANGVLGIRSLDARELREFEPRLDGLAAIHSPATGITSFQQVAHAFAGDVLASGGSVHTGCGVEAVDARSRGLQLRHARGATLASHAVFCAGAWSDRLALACGAGADPRIVPFRGAYLRVRAPRRDLVGSLIYPVPDPSLPFLGVHLTRTIDGELLIGPTALLAGARDAYRLRSVRPRDVVDTISWPGTWRVLGRWWRTGVEEIRHAVLRESMVGAVRRYVPSLEASDLEPAFAGVRAQAVARDGAFIEDFAFSLTERALHVRNAPSPAATASLAIAEHVADRARQSFDLA
jgi:2-hydroxyglutarate dehydrogenase